MQIPWSFRHGNIPITEKHRVRIKNCKTKCKWWFKSRFALPNFLKQAIYAPHTGGSFIGSRKIDLQGCRLPKSFDDVVQPWHGVLELWHDHIRIEKLWKNNGLIKLWSGYVEDYLKRLLYKGCASKVVLEDCVKRLTWKGCIKKCPKKTVGEGELRLRVKKLSQKTALQRLHWKTALKGVC